MLVGGSSRPRRPSTVPSYVSWYVLGRSPTGLATPGPIGSRWPYSAKFSRQRLLVTPLSNGSPSTGFQPRDAARSASPGISPFAVDVGRRRLNKAIVGLLDGDVLHMVQLGSELHVNVLT